GKSGELYLGLMSGTSMDGIDAAIVRLGDRSCEFVAGACTSYPLSIRENLQNLRSNPQHCSVDEIGQLDTAVGECFADATNGLIESSGIRREDIVAIGSHGQTIRHQPNTDPRFTLQIGDPNTIAARTGIAVVADFRRADMAVGGQGAPLAPAFHQWLFGSSRCSRAVVNIGGIANITMLPATTGAVIGFDTGPGNTLLDAWIKQSLGHDLDDHGAWAGGGTINNNLLSDLLRDDYFAAPAPKSTGFEYFNLAWLKRGLAKIGDTVSSRDVQATLAELSARTIAEAVLRNAADTKELFVCGGGYFNHDLMARIEKNLPGVDVQSTTTKGIEPAWIEAAAFAWLARCRIESVPGNLPTVTGAQKRALLGGIFLPPL
ncbi:MAG: anhydro-N-acetylmuramic acid kinase, partial [Woeseiaceae bacterium]